MNTRAGMPSGQAAQQGAEPGTELAVEPAAQPGGQLALEPAAESAAAPGAEAVPAQTTESTAPVAAIIPAKDEAQRIAATVHAVQRIPGVDLVVVVDDGSTDQTSALAASAGAHVVRHTRNRGKAAAMATGATVVAERDGAAGAGRHLLFVDADLEATASNLGVLVEPVVRGTADMTIAILPAQRQPGGGRGLVVNLARRGIVRLTGWTPTQPLSGMRCLTRTAFDAAQPMARGWGVEVGLTVDVLRAGKRVVEVPCDLHHRVTGRDWRAQVHRAKQYRDVWLALATRRVRITLSHGSR